MTIGERIELDTLFAKAQKAKRRGLGLDRSEDERLLTLFGMEQDEITAMMRKQAEAQALTMDLNEADKMKLLDLLLTERIRGTV